MYGALVAVLVVLVGLVGLVTSVGGTAAPTGIDPAGHVPDLHVVDPTPEPIEEPAPVDYAIADFAAHTGADPDDIEVVLNQNVTWPDGSLGCPQPDHMYLPVQVDGYLIVLHAQPEVATYHGAHGQQPFRCDRTDPSLGEPGLTGPHSR